MFLNLKTPPSDGNNTIYYNIIYRQKIILADKNKIIIKGHVFGLVKLVSTAGTKAASIAPIPGQKGHSSGERVKGYFVHIPGSERNTFVRNSRTDDCGNKPDIPVFGPFSGQRVNYSEDKTMGCAQLYNIYNMHNRRPRNTNSGRVVMQRP